MFAWRSGSQRSLGQLLESWFGSSAPGTQPSDAKSDTGANAPTPSHLTSRATAERKPG